MSYKFPSQSYSLVDESTPWQGSCGDSFCWPSCTSPECRPDWRLGATKKEHNKILREMRAEEMQAAEDLLEETL